MSHSAFILFDLDGTLVDSELLNSQAIVDLNPEIPETAATLSARYHGMRLATIMEDLERRFTLHLPADYIERYRARLSLLFDQQLEPIAGVAEMLEGLPYPRCVASSAAGTKIRQALSITGLSSHFGSKLFSSYDIGSWKPEPGIFLHAAREMGCDIEDAIVVDDSIHGVNAARAAGIYVLHFTKEASFDSDDSYRQFSNMNQLRSLIEKRIARRKKLCD